MRSMTAVAAGAMLFAPSLASAEDANEEVAEVTVSGTRISGKKQTIFFLLK